MTISDGDEEVELITYGDVAAVGDVESVEGKKGYRLVIRLTDGGAEAFADGLDKIGAFQDPQAHELRAYLDGEVVYTATLSPNLAKAIKNDSWNGHIALYSDKKEDIEGIKEAIKDL